MNGTKPLIGKYVIYDMFDNMKSFEAGMFVQQYGQELGNSELFPKDRPDTDKLTMELTKTIKQIETVELYSGNPRQVLNLHTGCITEYSPLENLCQLAKAIKRKG